MNILFSGAFWGIFLILLGVSVLLKVFFQIDVPVFRTLFGVMIVWIGVSVLMGRPPFKVSGDHQIVFGEGDFKVTDKGEYSVIFGKGRIDLTNVNLIGKKAKVEINTVFGESVVVVDPEVPVKVKGDTAFGSLVFPDGQTAAFGSASFETSPQSKTGAYLEVESNTVFGSTRFVYKK